MSDPDAFEADDRSCLAINCHCMEKKLSVSHGAQRGSYTFPHSVSKAGHEIMRIVDFMNKGRKQIDRVRAVSRLSITGKQGNPETESKDKNEWNTFKKNEEK